MSHKKYLVHTGEGTALEMQRIDVPLGTDFAEHDFVKSGEVFAKEILGECTSLNFLKGLFAEISRGYIDSQIFINSKPK